MAWNYRWILGSDGTYACHEVYYDDGGRRATSMTEHPVALSGYEKISEARADLQRMVDALIKPSLRPDLDDTGKYPEVPISEDKL